MGVFHMTEQPVRRICSQCGFKDHSAIPPIACPRCHFQPDNPVTTELRNARQMNRRERRVEAAKNRRLVRQTQRKLLRVEKLRDVDGAPLQRAVDCGPILHWSTEGEAVIPGEEPLIGEGVRGTAFDMPDGVYIPLIRAENPGTGDVARFLDALPKDRRVVFPNVVSSKLQAMLERRGFVSDWDPSGECEVFARNAQEASNGK
jgi:hypothetical protein